MPNWVSTTMSVSGDEALIKQFTEQAARPYRTFNRGGFNDGKYEPDLIIEGEREAPISFWNFIEPQNKDAYFGPEPKTDPSMTVEERIAKLMDDSSVHWYDWNIRNWGTKWDACDPAVVAASETSVTYSFSTAWSPAEGAFRAMVEQFPSLEFRFDCLEEQGWGVEFAGKDGDIYVVREWDVPTCHTDWVNAGLDCVQCANYDEDEWYSDCPRDLAPTD